MKIKSFEKLNANKLDDKFLKIQTLPKLTQGETEKLN